VKTADKDFIFKNYLLFLN